MKKRRIQRKTCFAMGLAGAMVYALAGALMVILQGPVAMPMVAALVLTGAMLLFLATLEKGDEKKAFRTKLLVIFLLLLASYPNLPPLNYLCEALVAPLVMLLYGGHRNRLCFGVLLAAELSRLVLRCMGVVDYFAPHTLSVEGVSLVLTAAARFWALLLLWRQAAKETPLADDSAAPRLR